MKPAAARTDATGASVRVEFQVQFSRGPKGRRKVREGKGNDHGPDRTPIPSGRDQDKPAPTLLPVQHALPPPTPAEPTVGRVPKITLLLVLGHYFERLVRESVVRDYAEIARRTGLSRARVTQVVDLTLLAPEIQELTLLAGSPLSERLLRSIVKTGSWWAQRALWKPTEAHK